MTLLEEPEPPSSSNRYLLPGILLVVAAAIAAGIWMMSGTSKPDVQPAPAPAPVMAKKAEPAPLPKAPEPEPAPAPSPKRPKAGPAKPAEPPPPPTTGTLQFESDVPGASVFVDREYKGVTPLTVEGVAPGAHKINLSADGYDGYADTLEVTAGPNAVLVRFKDVKLNETVAVVHKHALGSCKGQLLADPAGIRYEASKADDAFAIPFARIEVFDVDYLKRNLRIKVKGGKTYNFTNESADALFVFHKNVQAARAKLAKEGAPAAPAR
jgi:hypothetical protein